MAKRKWSTAAVPSVAADSSITTAVLDIPPIRRAPVPLQPNVARPQPKPQRRQPSRGGNFVTTNPNANPDILDGPSALRASPDSGEYDGLNPVVKPRVDKTGDAGHGGDAGPAPPNGLLVGPSATTETTTTGQEEHSLDRPGQGTIGLGADAEIHTKATNAVAPASETAAGDLPAQPSKNKRRRALQQHVKADSAQANISAVNASTQDVTRSIGDTVKVEEDVGVTIDPEVDDAPKDENGDEEDIGEALSRPPPVNSDYLPLPWKGRLGYACLNTYLRNANPPVFSSRTCRIASILEHRHPLKDPSQPEHPTKNRPDKEQPADVARGQKYVEELGLANARDIIKMVRWNDRYGIKFMRLSSEMFPFASHDVYGYKLEPFAADTLAEAGKVIAELGHRVTTHPGQYTQLGSPRKEVITAAIRDLEYHEEMLSLLKLPPQQDRDAVMILHLGGAFGDRSATLDRFRENYAKLSPAVKKRLVLENDDVVWSVHELLPLCQELNIPFVLDFHHHNIVFDSSKIREGTKDIMELFPDIIETWTKKGITPKMHYSEPCLDAITARARRKHSPRVMTLPPCPDTMDLMIEAKDKEQAVFELMRIFKLPGSDLFNDMIPHIRQDENKPFKPKHKRAAKKGKKKVDGVEALDQKIEDAEEEEMAPSLIPEEEVGMGGPERRVYWPPGMEDWLRLPKRIVKRKEEGDAATPAKKKRKTTAAAAEDGTASVNGEVKPAKKAATKKAAGSSATKKKAQKAVPTPLPTDDEGDSDPLSDLASDGDTDVEVVPKKGRTAAAPPASTRKRSGRVSKINYKEEDLDDMSV